MNKVNYPLFKKEDIDGFFALFQNNLANFVLIAVAMIGMGYPEWIVYKRVIPGAAISVLFGNLYYAHMAKKLSQKENRSDVTALSYGISTPVMFIYLFGVLRPALDITGNPETAWKIGMAACFLGGVVEAIGSIVGKWIRDHLPRASMLGALAGVAFAFIGGELFFKTYEMPVVGMVVLTFILIGLIGKKSMPFKIPTSLFAIIIGTTLAYIIKSADPSQIAEGFSTVGFYIPIPTFGFLSGISYLMGPMIGLFAILIPISIYNFIETMNNVEAMSAAGDSYNVQEAQFADGLGTMIGSLFGGVFPTTVYIASIGSKWMNAGRGYCIINGIVFLIASTFGIIAAMSKIIPVPVIAPILVFVGISMVSQAFSSVDKKHYPAVVIAMFPYFANYIMTRFNGSAGEIVNNLSTAIVPLGQGAMFTGLIWGAILVYIIDYEFDKAAYVSIVGSLLSLVGFMHAPKLSIVSDYQYVLGYAIIGFMFMIFSIKEKNKVPTKKKFIENI
ncbi:putative MFS transporter, AGZA family, xanthine/uracil permease [Alkalithermobacter thermoalcaliphilus JW-YL-7 = DSM 7308]|uniref:MFS transporter, AGZA family, xanthine/uracil permease n=1 Tax=Alkalithermobacter thermoalcaliphilus JW-YL-7 = DSM 7308 TaxID=1121328 RepID=A0A150FMR0_CLOPD|nr:Xanthine/uracil/vitamin C permease [[Clostridium] paradoxum JW-YL-7 = DSM 7308]SHL21418.1 putative MFS transporter, AGZA family, xanthine/uracil permease [[Clostridium] paradoxum JW-YL-7 = DSM 7308]